MGEISVNFRGRPSVICELPRFHTTDIGDADIFWSSDFYWCIGDLRGRPSLNCELLRFYIMEIWDRGIYWSRCNDCLEDHLYLEDYSRRYTDLFLHDVAALCNEHARLTTRCERIRRLEEEMLDHYSMYEDQYEHRYRLGSRFAQLEERIRRMKVETRYLLHRSRSALPQLFARAQNGRYILYDKDWLQWLQTELTRNSAFRYDQRYHASAETSLGQHENNTENLHRYSGQDDTMRARSVPNTPRGGGSPARSAIRNGWIQDSDISPGSTSNIPGTAFQTAVLGEKAAGASDSDLFQQRLWEMLGESETFTTSGRMGSTGSCDDNAHPVAVEETRTLRVLPDEIKDSNRLFEKKLTETMETFRQNVVAEKEQDTEVHVKEVQQQPSVPDPPVEEASPKRSEIRVKREKKAQSPRKQVVTGGLGNDKLNQQIIEGLTRNVNERFYQTCGKREGEEVNVRNTDCEGRNGKALSHNDQQQTARQQMREKAQGLENLLKTRNKSAESKLPRRIPNHRLTDKGRGLGTSKEGRLVTDSNSARDFVQVQTPRKLKSPRPMRTLKYTEEKRGIIINNVRNCMIKERPFSIVSDVQKKRGHVR
ncbi:uncharacterized protein [Haliotis asinina]|uniref:uncharacterized protein n=1 Tax=Haliotis asinina TaxID=109174 RepID=UPI003532599A